MEDTLMSIQLLQLTANLSALVVIGWIYLAYVKNLRSIAKAKDSQIAIVETNLRFWKDKASELEKRTPEYIEKILTERIKIREEELKRLHDDTEGHKKQIQARNEDLSRLRSELEKAKDVGRSIVIYDRNVDDEVIVPNAELELELLGEVFVDSATLMIVDPFYIRSDWQDEEYKPLPRRYRDVESGKIFEWMKDFTHYNDQIEEIGESVNSLLKRNRLEQIKEDYPSKYGLSLAGALYASGSERKCGVLRFNNGEEGAGIAFGTVHGDGVYPVFGEKYNGVLLRIYVDLQ